LLKIAGRTASVPANGHFSGEASLAIDIDEIEALSPDRAALWDRVTKAPFLTVNEKRAAAGFGAVPGGDSFARARGVRLSCEACASSAR
jgi:phage portal protein BeeE